MTRATQNALRHGDARVGQVTRLHKIWRDMLKRCNPNLASPNPKYAGRGIRVCAEWRAYLPFKTWALANGYRDDLSIERNDNDGNYEPSNCRWIAPGRQARNRRNSRFVEHDGQRLVIAEWSEKTGIKAATLSWRVRQGWSEDRVFAPVTSLEVE